MRAGQRAQLCGEREGHQEVGTGQEMAALFFNPAFGLILVTLRTGTIPAGVIRENFLLAVIALMDMASEERRAAGGNIPQSPFLHRTQTDTSLLAKCCAVEADDIGHLRHEDPGFRGLA